ncbi:hypothetical protein HPP92_014565 [Vanilla planifolia]|uniref:GDSL esterase/lipase EXL3 n=1 Tax=Vanilla planifolia TaxID=51239 RepID=A0A835UT90_VANPL|nr:hypothetical protein HPP92_014565 [Vanilla planifolia]
MDSMRAAFITFLHVAILSSLACAKGNNRTSPRPPAIVVFGDSIVDPGNNNAILTTVKCNFPPYGKDFVHQQATGRFSNGKIPSDLMASVLGIKEYVPAYLGTKLSAQELITGVSFASGGCGFDPLTADLVSAISMEDQLNLFKEYKEKKLYHLGARKISVVSAPPIGCLPSQRTLAGGIERICNPTYNQAAVAFNSRLSNEMQKLNNTLPRTRILYVDLYTPLLDIILHPLKYGFVESKRGCCGTGTFEVTLTCNSLTTLVCEDASKYVFWDSYHPTERAYRILISNVVQRYGAFIN